MLVEIPAFGFELSLRELPNVCGLFEAVQHRLNVLERSVLNAVPND